MHCICVCLATVAQTCQGRHSLPSFAEPAAGKTSGVLGAFKLFTYSPYSTPASSTAIQHLLLVMSP